MPSSTPILPKHLKRFNEEENFREKKTARRLLSKLAFHAVSAETDDRNHRINNPSHNLRVLLQQGGNEIAYNFTRSLILSAFSLCFLFLLTLSDMLRFICSGSELRGFTIS
ncbi:hypothetical protein Peur_006810 [Populus x canadensis]